MNATDANIHCTVSEVDVGFVCNKSLKALLPYKKISDRAALEFKKEYQQFLIKIAGKMLEKSPVLYRIVRCAVCLDPQRIVSKPKDCERKFRLVLEQLANANLQREDECDTLIRQFSNFFGICSLKAW